MMNEYPNEEYLFTKLKVQRHKQIQREGVNVTYISASYPYKRYFAFDYPFKGQLVDMLKESKYPIQLCDVYGKTILKLSPSDLFFSNKPQDMGKLFISSQIFMNQRSISNGQEYFLVKSNPTLNAYKDNLSQDKYLFTNLKFVQSPHLMQYFKGQTEKIPSSMVIKFPQQKDLNAAQNQAIIKSGLNALTFIKGPPGCGKTKTITRLCKLFLLNKKKVIVGAVSNTGNLSIVRQLIEQLSQYNKHSQLLKLYNQHAETNLPFYYYLLTEYYDQYMKYKLIFYPPFDMDESQLPPLIRIYSYDTVVIKNMIAIQCKNHEDGDKGTVIKDVLEQYRLLKQKKKVRNRFYAILMQAVGMITLSADIIIATTVKSKSINSKLDQSLHYKPHVAILDEASQSSISDTLCYLKLDIQKLILVGDDKQLSPTVITNDKLLKKTLFLQYGQNKKEYFTMLDCQYRMHPAISSLANQLFYQGEIKDGVSGLDRSSSFLPFSNHPIMFINSPFPEKQQIQDSRQGARKTYVNYHQIYIIKMYLMHLPSEQLRKVGIITPYADQLKLLQKYFAREIKFFGLTIKTCDGYQGGEKDYVFISLVRSNEEGNIGFCSEPTRINVSITRAKRGLIIVGSASTFLKTFNYWGAIIKQLHDRQVYFDYSLEIPEKDLQVLKILHKPTNSSLINQEYPQYAQYKIQFLKQYPNQPEQIIQQYYTAYINDLIYQNNPSYHSQQPAASQEIENDFMDDGDRHNQYYDQPNEQDGDYGHDFRDDYA